MIVNFNLSNYYISSYTNLVKGRSDFGLKGFGSDLQANFVESDLAAANLSVECFL